MGALPESQVPSSTTPTALWGLSKSIYAYLEGKWTNEDYYAGMFFRVKKPDLT